MDVKQVFRFTVIAGLFLSAFVPFVVISSMPFPFIDGKHFFFRIIVEVVFVAWLLLMLLDHNYIPRLSWISFSVVSFVSVLALATIFGESPTASFWSNFERMEGLLSFVHLLAYFLVLTSFLTAENLWRYFLNLTFFVSAVLSFMGLPEILNANGGRIGLSLGNPTYLAVFLLFNIFIGLYLFLSVENSHKYLKWFYGVFVSLHIFVLVNTLTRGTTLGLLAGLFVFALITALFERGKPVLRKGAWISIIAIFSVVIGVWALKDTDFANNNRYLQRFATISFEEQTTRSRFMVWETAWQGVKERPLLGWGPESFVVVFSKYYNPQMYDQEMWFDRAHNFIFDNLVSAGFLGLIAYLSMFLSAFWVMWHKKGGSFSSLERAVFSGLLIAYLIHNLFVFDNLVSHMLFFTVLAFLSGRESAGRETIFNIDSDQVRRSAVIVFSLALVILVSAVYWFNIKPIKAGLLLVSDKTSYQEALDDLQKAASLSPLGIREIREATVTYVPQFLKADIPEDFKEAMISFSREEMEKQVEEYPGDLRGHMFLGHLYGQLGLYEEAKDIYSQAIDFSPTRQYFYFVLGETYAETGDLQTSVSLAKKAYEIEKSNPEAGVTLALWAIRAKEIETAQAVFAETSIDVWGNDRVFLALVEHGYLDFLFELQEKKVAERPLEMRYRHQLAELYLHVGDKVKAAGEYGRAIEVLEESISDGAGLRAFKDLAVVYMRLGNQEEAVGSILRAEAEDLLTEAEMEEIIVKIRAGDHSF